MKRTVIIILLALCSVLSYGQKTPYLPEDNVVKSACTSIVVGKDASDDGSVMTAHTCDSNFRTWLTIEPRRKFAHGARDEIRWGLMHTEEPHDTRGVEVKGSIPAPEHETYRFMNVAYPCMNEKQLAIGETTTEGRQDLRRSDALFLIEELERVALQRCSTARDAIRLMGSLAEEYGFADNGECLTVIDKNEAWFFEIYGSGKSGSKPGALWVAQRIPDGHVGISANVPRIGTVDFSDPENFMYASDLRERCKELELWDGKSPFKFYKMVSEEGENGKNFSHREVFVFNTLDPSLGLSMKDEEIPFSIKPWQKVSARKMFELYRSTYEGTDFDMLKNLNTEVKRWTRNEEGQLVAISDTTCPVSPYMTNAMRSLLNTLKPGTVSWAYTISVIQCSYSQIIKLRNWLPDEVGGVAYFAFDIPALTPRVPIYAGQTKLPAGFDVCGQKRYRQDAAIWKFRETNRLAAFGWNRTAGMMRKALEEYDDMLFDDAPLLEKKAVKLIKEGRMEEAIELLNSYCSRLSASQQKTWEELKAEFWIIFARSL
ncbi:MAG: C69 family dipeptidase [Bacteroidales bacterium]|nr:C69 family dipeptidase [Bacteroidales bacterium]